MRTALFVFCFSAVALAPSLLDSPCAALPALVAPSGPSPETLDYDAVLDRPIDWARDTKDAAHEFRNALGYVAKDGSVVFAGTDHRLVIQNARGSPMYKGLVPNAERQRISRSGGPRRYCPNWQPGDLSETGLTPVRVDEDWGPGLRPAF